ncbi:MAG TPA: hypothetical protein PKD86_05585 [Gemmatales bacterium]|nr:hypothetical protein [Gemmatales bacterium]HMP58805.1 hypothetical protein [Gemmatales bacterium]
MLPSWRDVAVLCATALLLGWANQAHGQPTLKGPIDGLLVSDPATPGFMSFFGSGHLTLMGAVAVRAEFQFVPGNVPGTLQGVGIAAIVAANGDVLVSNVRWVIDPSGQGKLEFRWPGVITFQDGTVVASTGRFTSLPFGGLRGTSTLLGSGKTRLTMTGEIVDPDPLD